MSKRKKWFTYYELIFFLLISDFEYCSYNYRSFDIANHFAEWAYDYTCRTHPFYKEDWSNYPTEKQRMAFVRAYLHERGSRESPKKVLREVEVFTMASHLFWGVWALINAETSSIPFGYWVSHVFFILSWYPVDCRIRHIFNEFNLGYFLVSTSFFPLFLLFFLYFTLLLTFNFFILLSLFLITSYLLIK